MKNNVKTIINSIINSIRNKDSEQTEFIQAVTEVLTSLEDFLQENPQLSRNNLLERLVEPERVVIFRVPWQTDKGEYKINRGYRVQFNSALGPYKGGLRFHPSVNLSILKFLGFEQIFKNSLTGLPLGGGKGGSDFDPKGKSDDEIMRFCQSFINELYRHIGENIDVPAGDIGVGGREVAYMFGQYKRLTGDFTGVLTGKGLDFGGSLIRTEATGYGAVYFLEAMLTKKKQTLKNKRVLISGAGNVAVYAAEKVLQLGGKVITLSDSTGVIIVKEGITESLLEEIKELKFINRGRLSELKDKIGVEYRANKNPWELELDAEIAIPSATQNEIDKKLAENLHKNGIKYVVEGANMPSTNEAISVYNKHKMIFAPGKAANAGGVAVSGLEMSQNSQRIYWTRTEVDKKLKEIMNTIHDQAFKAGAGDYLKGANIAAFRKIATSMQAQGLV